MARFDVCRDPDGPGLLLVVQSDLIARLYTRVVVPLLPELSVGKVAARLNPRFVVNGEAYVMATQFIAAVPLGILGRPVANLADRHTEIVNAIDFLLQGY